MSAYTITIAELLAGKPVKRSVLVIRADDLADLHCAIDDGLKAAFGECDFCHEWFPEAQLTVLKRAGAGDQRACPDCKDDATRPHPQDCRCRDCRDGREAEAEAVGDAIRDGDPVREDDW